MKKSKISFNFFLLILILFILPVSGQEDLKFDLSLLRASDPDVIEMQGDSILMLRAVTKNGALIIEDKEILNKIKDYKYLIMKISHESSYSGIIQFDFFQDGAKDPRIMSKIGVLPDMPGYVVFPIEYLNGQNIFIERYPWQLKGVVFGKRTDASALTKISIIPGPFKKPEFMPEFKITSMYLSTELPEFDPVISQPLVDEYGQWTAKDWEGKIRNEADWEKHKSEQLVKTATDVVFMSEWSDYGGWKELRFDSTGFFHTHHDGERWWFVDPDGYAFLSYGMDCVRPVSNGLLNGSEKLYKWIPEQEGEYKKAFLETRNLKMVDFLVLNMIRMFGDTWYTQWQKLTRNKLIEGGFNTVGNWSDIEFARNSRMPYVLPLSRFPTTEIKLYRDFPDVFSPQYRFNAKTFAEQLEVFKDDKYLIGYFLSNEPHWAFGDNDVAFEMFAVNEMSFTRMKFTDWLKEKYSGNLDSLNLRWDIQLLSFEQLRDKTFTAYPGESKSDFQEFTGIMVDNYVSIVCDEVRKIDPNHLNLGMRYAYIASEYLYRAGDHFDVFSINGYSPDSPPETSVIYEKTSKPVLIGEFHHGSPDRGLPSTGLVGVATQKDRGKAYRYYVEHGFSRPEIIGIHYFQWMDQAILGRFDGENYNIGFNDIVYQEYDELYDAALKTHKKSYKLAKNRSRTYNKKAARIPVIAF